MSCCRVLAAVLCSLRGFGQVVVGCLHPPHITAHWDSSDCCFESMFLLVSATISDIGSLVDEVWFVEVFDNKEFFTQAQITAFSTYFISLAFF